MSIDWDSFRRLVNAGSRFLLTSHMRPDCDALGSELAMAQALESLGKQCSIVNGQATPSRLSFIDPQQKIGVCPEDPSGRWLDAFDVFMVLDTSAWGQLGPMADALRSSRAAKVVLDHHVGSDDLGATVFKDVAAEAAGTLVIQAIDALQARIDAEMAMQLFAAIATDTGWFRFSNVRSRTFQDIARLVAAGADPAAIYRNLYEQDSLARIQLIGRILARTVLDCQGKLAHTAALREDFAETGAQPSDTEDIINTTLHISGVEAAVIFIEQLDNQACKISFRSRGKLDCNRLAGRFGGGGHTAAAGTMLQGSYETVRTSVLEALRRELPCD